MDPKAAQINEAVRARRGDKSGARLGLRHWHFGLCAGRSARQDQRPAAEQGAAETAPTAKMPAIHQNAVS